MITCSVEQLEDVLPEMKLLFGGHWEELALDKASVPLDPQYDVYLERERQGQTLTVVMRENALIIGYWVGFIAPGLHYRTCLTATMDIFYIKPEARGGTKALKMFRFVERELVRRGVQRWIMGTKLHHDVGRMFEALGLRPIETYYSKLLKE